MEYLDRLNPGQREAVLMTEGPVRVVAGPGTGKTRALVARYCHLVDGLGIPPRNILCVTFTNKAADEMKRRVRAILGSDMDLGLVCTFHAFARLMLKTEIHRLNYPPSFPILDREDMKGILGKIYGEMGLSSRDMTLTRAIDEILETGKLHTGYVEEFMLAWAGPGAGGTGAPHPPRNKGGLGTAGGPGGQAAGGGPAPGGPEARRGPAQGGPAASGGTARSRPPVRSPGGGDGPPRPGAGTGARPEGADRGDRLKAELARGDLDWKRRVFLSYLREQKRCYALDFNDLINFALYVLDTFPEAKALWQDRLQYVMVDEFQDVSGKQYRLGEILSGKHNNLFIVGDQDQTIYTWRGSHRKLFLNFPERHGGAGTVSLSVNYRSTPQILAASETLIARNPDRIPNPLEAVAQDGYKPVYFNGKTASEAAEWTASEAERIRNSGVPLSDVAVLCRASHMSRPVENALFNAKLPYRVLCGTPFYQRWEVKTAVCYLRMLVHADDMAFLRTFNTPPRMMGKKTLDMVRGEAERSGLLLYDALGRVSRAVPGLWRKAGPGYLEVIDGLRKKRSEMGLADLFEELLDRTGYEESLRRDGDDSRLDNLAELKRGVSEFAADPEATLEDFLDKAALYTSRDAEGTKDALTLMTVHAAKGLEFDSVFVCGLNEGSFPSRRCETPEDMEEERRILYVAMTRAKQRLMLTSSDRPAPGEPFSRPSRFLFEMARELEGARPKDMELLLENSPPGETPETGGDGYARRSGAAPAFVAGDRVVHPSFGRGEILAVKMREGSYSIKFDALSTARDISFAALLSKE
ncbi:MAG: UvrD-helicase domain-containing protein [Deltaproteobacteria bacterium]|jgi:DNA helicase-2/ATP-dependent DNA helicase PcrA|nr:UvrD-helicase domain-containing protein [Deltaproteobacteria bacterium]